MMSAFAHFTEEIRLMMEKQASSERMKLEHGVHQLALDVAAFKRSLKTRKKLQYAYTTKQNQIKQSQKQMNSDKKKNIDKISAELHELEKASSVLKVKLEECSVRVTTEATRVRPNVEWKLKNCLRDYADIQIKYGEMVREAWVKLMPKFSDEGDGVETEVTGKLTTIQLADAASAAVHPPPAAAPPPVPPTAPPAESFPDILPDDTEADKPAEE